MLGWAVACVLGPAAVVGLAIFLLGPVSSLIAGPVVHDLKGKEEADALNAVRQILLQTIAGSAGVIVLVFTARTYLLNRRGQVTDRYAKAVEMLASEKLGERIGGIYALEHIMIESERDHESIVEVLTTFVREHAPAATMTLHRPASANRWLHPPTGTPDIPRASDPPEPTADIQAALTVLGHRPQRSESRPLNLRCTDLRGADLREAHLDYADLREAHLEHASLIAAHLKYADLREAHLEHASLTVANLERADLHRAHLEHANLHRANLTVANLCEAHLEHAILIVAHLKYAELREAHLEYANLSLACLESADLREAHLEHANLPKAHLEDAILSLACLSGVDLSSTRGLTQYQIDRAVVSTETRLPSHLASGEHEGSAS